MEGLTTRFDRPPPTVPGLVTREKLGIPPPPTARIPPALRDGGDGSPETRCGALYLVPQTLYKLHPDFDRLVAGVLRGDPSGCAVFIQALDAPTTEGIARRLSRALADAGVAPERAVFVRRSVRRRVVLGDAMSPGCSLGRSGV